MFNLDDIRYFLAVAEVGTLSGAARRLGVTQPTVGRRINDIESALGTRLFVRSLSGYQVTETGLEILVPAKVIEKSAWSINNRIAVESEPGGGRVRLTIAEGLGIQCLPRLLPEFHETYPLTSLDISVHNSFSDLLRHQSDVAIRIGKPGSDLVIGRVICNINIGLYASSIYLKQHGTPESINDLTNHDIITPLGDLAKTQQAKRLRELLPERRCRLGTNNIVAQLAFTQNGLGIASLPDYLVESNDLVRVLPDDFDLDLPLWILNHREFKDNVHVQNVKAFMLKHFEDADSRVT